MSSVLQLVNQSQGDDVVFNFRSLRARFVASVVVIAIIMFLLLWGFTYFVLGTLLTSKTLNELTESTGREAAHIEGWFSEIESSIATAVRFMGMLDTEDQVYHMLRTQAEGVQGVLYTAVGFADGFAIFSDGWVPPRSWSVTEFDWWYETIANRDRMYIGPPGIDAVNGDFTITASMYAGTVMGRESVYSIALSLDAVLQFVQNLYMSREGYAFLVDSEGRIVVHPNEDFMPVIRDVASREKDSTYIFDIPHYAGLADAQEVMTSEINGVEFFMQRYDLPRSGWSLFVGVPSSYVMANVNNMMLWYSLIALFVTIGMVASIWMISTASIKKPVARLSELVDNVVNGNLTVNTGPYKLTSDEIGQLTGRVYTLAHTIKNISEDLEEFTHEWVVNGDVEYRIDESKYQGDYRRIVK